MPRIGIIFMIFNFIHLLTYIRMKSCISDKKMCYHNSLVTDNKKLEARYKKMLNKGESTFSPIYHASGFDHGLWPIITPENEAISFGNWGLIPHFITSEEESLKMRALTLNAKVETLSEKASFKNAKRCIIPSTGFFEWQHTGKQKIPFFIHIENKEIFSMAGLYEMGLNKLGKPTYTFSIVTTEANELMSEIHNTKKRMPVILNPEEEHDWFDNCSHFLDFKKTEGSNKLLAYSIGDTLLKNGSKSQDIFLPKQWNISKQMTLF
ncbi:MAG: SOS response-associated peptidase [Leadbetterella sp.]